MPWAHRDEGAFEHPADRSRRCAEVEGFSLHAGVAVAAKDRVGLERLCPLRAAAEHHTLKGRRANDETTVGWLRVGAVGGRNGRMRDAVSAGSHR